MSMRSPLGRVRGLGSAREGGGHWWAVRKTAGALIPLALWFVVRRKLALSDPGPNPEP